MIAKYISNKRKKYFLSLANIILMPFYLFFYPYKIIYLYLLKRANWTPKTFLIVRLDHLGDVVLATALPRMIRTKFPNAKIFFLVGSWAVPLIKENPFIDKIITMDCPWWQNIRKENSNTRFWKEYFTILKYLHSNKIDVCIELRGDLRHLILFGIFPNAKMIISSNRSGGDVFITNKIPYKPTEHEFNKNMLHLEPLSIFEKPLQPEIFTSEKDKIDANSLLKIIRAKDHEIIVAFCPGARVAVKQLSLEKNIELCQSLLRTNKKIIHIILIGAKSDMKLCKQIGEGLGYGISDFSGQTSITVLVELFKLVDVVIGVDSGALHIASSSPTPIIALFGATDPKLYKPFSPNTHVISSECFCNRNLHLECYYNPQGSGLCMNNISVEDILETFNKCIRNKHNANIRLKVDL